MVPFFSQIVARDSLPGIFFDDNKLSVGNNLVDRLV